MEISMRLYEGTILKPLQDIRDEKFKDLHHSLDYHESQIFGKKMRLSNSWGLIYDSVRHIGGQCVAMLRPPAISIPTPASHFRYLWNGEKITEVFDAHLLYSF